MEKFTKGSIEERREIYASYLAHIDYINNWDLVDCSAHTILGAFLRDRDRDVLYRLVDSQNLWERRIAIVATWHFIRTGQVADTFKLAALLLEDEVWLTGSANTCPTTIRSGLRI